MLDVFIVGCKGVPANYGGYETFADNLVSRKIGDEIHYHVACLNPKFIKAQYQGADLFGVQIPNIGPAKAVFYDSKALDFVISFVKENRIRNFVVLILTCRIGIFYMHYSRIIHKLGGSLYLNPDGHEWKRSKWPWIVKKYWKYSERKMVKFSDLIICDSLNIEKYIKTEYQKYKPLTKYIAYGADVIDNSKIETKNTEDFVNWLKAHHVSRNMYFLMVGRFVPENNFAMVIQGFLASNTTKKLVIISDIDRNQKFYKKILKSVNGLDVSRIDFAGTVYDKKLLSLIRQNAFCYIHGHSVGGTNPSLLEALGTTDVNLLFDVSFNREVGLDSCLYFSSSADVVARIQQIESFGPEERKSLGISAKKNIQNRYLWSQIVSDYQGAFLSNIGGSKL